MIQSDSSRRSRKRTTFLTAGLLLLSASGAAAIVGLTTSSASSHREAPLIAGDPQADNTDVYAFVSPDKPTTTTLVANWIPFEEPNGGPNFYAWATDAHYDIHVDNNGDGAADLTYQWTFTNHYRDDANQFLYNTGPVKNLTDPTLNFYQTYDLDLLTTGGDQKLVTGAIAAPSNVGAASIPSYAALRAQATKPLPGGGQQVVGQADDSFFLDLRVFDLLYGGNLSEAGHDTLSGYNVNNITLQVPNAKLALNGNAARNPVIGVWATTERKSTSVLGANGTNTKTGTYVQVSRLGNPLVNEVVVPLKYKDAFNALTPNLDHTVAPVVAKVTNPIVPALIQKIYGIPAPAAPRNDLVEIFLTGIAKNAPTLDHSAAPIQADLNSQVLNKDVVASAFVPAEEERLNMSIPPAAKPNRLGVLANDLQGFPNGRRLTDDVVDIELQALEGAAKTGQLVPALAAGDGVNANDHAFGSSFPYVALPNTVAVNQASAARTGTTPTGGVASGFGGSAHGTQWVLVPILAGFGGGFLALAGVMTLRRRRSDSHSTA